MNLRRALRENEPRYFEIVSGTYVDPDVLRKREYHRIKHAEYCKRNPGRVKEANAKWYAANKAKVIARRRAKYAEKKEYRERRNADSRAYYARHREKILARMKAAKLVNPEEYNRIRRIKRHARKAA